MTNATFNVEGMTCGHCKAAVEGELNGLVGVEHSNADPDTGLVEVRYDGDKVTTYQLERAIEEAGYTVAA